MPLGPEDVTLTAKTLTGGTISGSTLTGCLSTLATIGGSTLTGCNITGSTLTGNLASGSTLTAVKLLGTTTLPHITLTSNALLATPVAGAIEYDGVCFYDTGANTARGVRADYQIATLTTPYVLTDSTGVQKLLNASTNGAVTLGPNMTYLFDCVFNMSVTSTVAQTMGFSFAGTAAIGEQNWWVISNRAAATSVPTAALQSHHTAASTACLSVSSSLAQLNATIRGKLVITTSGTVIPSIFLGSSAVTGAPQIERGAYFAIWPIGSNSVNTVGAWT